MKVQLTVASCDGSRILNLQQFTDLKVINNLASNEVVEPVYDVLINKLYDGDLTFVLDNFNTLKAEYQKNNALLSEALNGMITNSRLTNNSITSDKLRIAEDSSKIKLINLSDEVIRALSGNATLRPTINEQEITRDKIADKAINQDKVEGLSFAALNSIVSELEASETTKYKWVESEISQIGDSIIYTGIGETGPTSPMLYVKAPASLTIEAFGCYQIVIGVANDGYITYNVKTGLIRKRFFDKNNTEDVIQAVALPGKNTFRVSRNGDLFINESLTHFNLGEDITPAVGFMLHKTVVVDKIAYKNVDINSISWTKVANNIANESIEMLGTSIFSKITTMDKILSNLSDGYVLDSEELFDSQFFYAYNVTKEYDYEKKIISIRKNDGFFGMFCIRKARILKEAYTTSNFIPNKVIAVDKNGSECIVYRGNLKDIIKVKIPGTSSDDFDTIATNLGIEKINTATQGDKIVQTLEDGIYKLVNETTGFVYANIANVNKYIPDGFELCLGGQIFSFGQITSPFVEAGTYINVADFTDMKTKIISNEGRIKVLEESGGSGGTATAVSRWKGKKWSVLGDSITADHSSSPSASAQVKYHDYIKSRISIATVSNHGQGGTCIAEGGQSNAFVNRYDKLDSDSDLITVWGGINDFWHSQSILGDMNSREKTTLYGALHILCEGLLTKYPKASIGFFTPLKKSNGNTANGKNVTLPQIRQAIIDVCQFYSIQVLDLYNVSGVTPTIPAILNEYMNPNDGVHLNNKGQEKVSFIIEKFIEQL